MQVLTPDEKAFQGTALSGTLGLIAISRLFTMCMNCLRIEEPVHCMRAAESHFPLHYSQGYTQHGLGKLKGPCILSE